MRAGPALLGEKDRRLGGGDAAKRHGRCRGLGAGQWQREDQANTRHSRWSTPCHLRAFPIPVLIEPKCSVCGGASARIEILEPSEDPQDLDKWESRWRELFRENRDRESWWLLFSSIGGANGVAGDPMSEDKAKRWIDALQEPLEFERVRSLDLYDDIGFCGECRKPYCATHWSVSSSGYGTCPEGHGKSLDPHWSP